MLNINELDYTIDSLKVEKKNSFDKLAFDLYARTSAPTLNANIEKNEVNPEIEKGNFMELFENNLKKAQLIELATSSINTSLNLINNKLSKLGKDDKDLNQHIIAYYDKFALAIACIILFFIGAPLGALIKKGGIGLPIVVAIIFFLTYHFIGIFAKNSAEDNSIDPILASWLSTIIMLPLSIYLTNRATKDRPLFELDGFLAPIKTILTKEATIAPLDSNVFLDKNSSEYEKIKGYSDKKLIDIVKNYRQYDLDESYRNSSIKILNARGITEEELRFGGNLRNENYENALRYKAAYVENSRLSFKLYFIYIIPLLAGLILNNNGFPTLGKILIVFGAISATLFLITLAKSFISQVSFNKLLDRNTTSNVFILILVGIPLYFLYFNFYKKKMKEDLKQIR